MRGLRGIGVVAVLAVIPAACILPLDVSIETDDDNLIRGSGRVVVRDWVVADFHAVSAWGVGRIVIEDTGREALTVTGEDNVLDHLDISVHNGELRMGPQRRTSLAPTQALTYRLEVDGMDRIEGSGAVEIDLTLEWCPRITVTLSGAAYLDFEGNLDSLDISASGAARFVGERLRSRVAHVVTSGAARAVVWATQHLKASASGVSSIRYLGAPETDVTVTGMATVGRF